MDERMTVEVVVNHNGRIVIPAAFRKALGIQGGDRLMLRLVDGEARLSTRWQRIKEAQRMVRQYIKPGRKLSEELIAERRKAALEE